MRALPTRLTRSLVTLLSLPLLSPTPFLHHARCLASAAALPAAGAAAGAAAAGGGDACAFTADASEGSPPSFVASSHPPSFESGSTSGSTAPDAIMAAEAASGPSSYVSTRAASESYTSTLRGLKRTAEAREQAEGQGARVRRSIGTQLIRSIDPFLMLDYFTVKPPAGFPPHPHRGFSTVTYMLEGSFSHEDFKGHAGVIWPGDLQWMNAGRGIVHSETPNENRVNVGLQLWVNLPKSKKMSAPEYQELRREQVPTATSPDGLVSAKVIAGQAYGVQANVTTHTPINYLDFTVQKDGTARIYIPDSHTGFVYLIAGEGAFGKDAVAFGAHHVLEIGAGNDLPVANTGDEPLRFMVITGEPIGEPVFQHGPFVMNTQEEIREAIMDFQMERNGFEGAQRWSRGWTKPTPQEKRTVPDAAKK